MAIVFVMTFNYLGAWLSDGMTMVVNWVIALIGRGLEVAGVSSVLQSLVVDGILSGIGSVIGFLPTIVTLFFFLSILEDTGYMARVAFVMDKLLRKIGLSGRSFVPMLIGFGCSVPAIMATRTLSSEFFPKQWRGVVMISLYFAGILCGILYALILKKTKYKGEPVPFVMELPNYRLPSAKSVGQLIWEKAKDFIQKAFTIIFAATLIVWFLQNFDAGLNLVTSTDQSLLAKIGSIVAPLFAPLGFGDWRVSTALITGFMAKESVVSTLTVLLGGNTALLQTLFTPFTAYVFLIFTLLYTPCVAAIATVRREMGTVRAAAGIVLVQCATAWIVAFAVHGVGMMLGL